MSKKQTSKAVVKEASKDVAELPEFSINELNLIVHHANVVKTCSGVPFAIANRINKAGIRATDRLKDIQAGLDLVTEREKESGETEQTIAEKTAIWDTKFPVELPSITEVEFENLEITGDKKVHDANANVQEFNYRESYFALVHLGVIK